MHFEHVGSWIGQRPSRILFAFGAVAAFMSAWIPLEDGLILLAASTLVATLVSEVTSNTASANIVVPVVIMVAKELHIDPLEPAPGRDAGRQPGLAWDRPFGT